MRPTDLKNYIGQGHIKAPLQDLISSAKMRNVSIDHILVHGTPGCIASGAEILINRAGKSFRMPIEQVEKMFNGGVTGSRRWDQKISTQVQILGEDGFGRLGTIKFVTYSGEKLS